MDKRTYDALQASIVKWERNTRVRNPYNAALWVHDCPLCQIYWKRDFGKSCKGCPVKSATLQKGCMGTPYNSAVDANDRWETPSLYGLTKRAAKRDWLEASRKMALFLRALVPAGGPDE